MRPHDHAFDDRLDAATWCRRIGVVVPTKSDQRRNPRFDKAAPIGSATGSSARATAQAAPAVATWCEQRGSNDQVMVTIAVFLVSL
jgi:hypothetical protein